MFTWALCLHVYLCIMFVLGDYEDQRKVSEPMDLEAPRGCRALNPPPLEEQSVLLSAKTFLQPRGLKVLLSGKVSKSYCRSKSKVSSFFLSLGEWHDQAYFKIMPKTGPGPVIASHGDHQVASAP